MWSCADNVVLRRSLLERCERCNGTRRPGCRTGFRAEVSPGVWARNKGRRAPGAALTLAPAAVTLQPEAATAAPTVNESPALDMRELTMLSLRSTSGSPSSSLPAKA